MVSFPEDEKISYRLLKGADVEDIQTGDCAQETVLNVGDDVLAKYNTWGKFLAVVMFKSGRFI